MSSELQSTKNPASVTNRFVLYAKNAKLIHGKRSIERTAGKIAKSTAMNAARRKPANFAMSVKPVLLKIR
jgi:hypothetical protein